MFKVWFVQIKRRLIKKKTLLNTGASRSFEALNAINAYFNHQWHFSMMKGVIIELLTLRRYSISIELEVSA
jgi:hypothetical protein